MKYLLPLAFLLPTSLYAAVEFSGPAIVFDGDTINVGPIVVRIHGIDAPEEGQTCSNGRGGSWACGTAATSALVDMIGGEDVHCTALDRDHYGRIIGRCTAGGVDVGHELVSRGLAWAYVEYSDDYVDLEQLARAAGAGIWQGENQTPWEYRADRWNRAAAESPREGCPIKGNISRSGERIYHTPWSPAYARTVISEDQGERWFCDEAEAQAAGWRAPRWR